jgi:hypothetical protein
VILSLSLKHNLFAVIIFMKLGWLLSLLLLSVGCSDESSSDASSAGYPQVSQLLFAPAIAYDPSVVQMIPIHTMNVNQDHLFMAVPENNLCAQPIGINFICTNPSGAPDSEPTGSIHVFNKANNWQASTLIQPSRSVILSGFNMTLATNAAGNRLVVGAPYDSSASADGPVCVGVNDAGCSAGNTTEISTSTRGYKVGAVYTYIKNNGTWQEEAFIKPIKSGNLAQEMAFGAAIALNKAGDYLAVGERNNPIDDENIYHNQPDIEAFYNNTAQAHQSGAVSVYEFTSNQWSQQAVISKDIVNKFFGMNVLLDGGADRMVVKDVNTMYTFTRQGTTWVEDASNITLTQFSSQMALSEDGQTLVLSLPLEGLNCGGVIALADISSQCTGTTARSGSVYVYHRDDNNTAWIKSVLIRSTAPTANFEFGRSLSLSPNGERLLISEKNERTCLGRFDDSSQCQDDPNVIVSTPDDVGVVHLYELVNNEWQYKAFIKEHQIQKSNQRFGLYNIQVWDQNMLISTKSFANSACVGAHHNLDDNVCEFDKEEQHNLLYYFSY